MMPKMRFGSPDSSASLKFRCQYADAGKHQRRTTERKCNRETRQQDDDHRNEQQ